jgi:peroxiredoxin
VELPRLEPLYQQYREQGFAVVAIDAMADTERATRFIDEKGLTYPMTENGEGEADVVAGLFGVRSFPTSFLIDGDGRVLAVHEGFAPGDEKHLEEEIRRVLAL